MSIDEKTLISEKELLTKDFNSLQEKIKQGENAVSTLKSNLNAVHGAIQQIDKLIGMVSKNKGKK
jgi:uncharacterized protein YlxW (UPF0749 family)